METKKSKKDFQDNDPCRRCGAPIKRKEGSSKVGKSRKQYFTYFFRCSGCPAVYFVESERHFLPGCEPTKKPRRLPKKKHR